MYMIPQMLEKYLKTLLTFLQLFIIIVLEVCDEFHEAEWVGQR